MKDNRVIKGKKEKEKKEEEERIGVHGHTMVKVSFNVVLSANKHANRIIGQPALQFHCMRPFKTKNPKA